MPHYSSTCLDQAVVGARREERREVGLHEDLRGEDGPGVAVLVAFESNKGLKALFTFQVQGLKPGAFKAMGQLYEYLVHSGQTVCQLQSYGSTEFSVYSSPHPGQRGEERVRGREPRGVDQPRPPARDRHREQSARVGVHLVSPRAFDLHGWHGVAA
jgi:hypothetical protein